MAKKQSTLDESRASAPSTVIEVNTATRADRGEMVAERPEEQLELLSINTIRTLAMDAVQKANSGHPGTPMALAPAAFVLWYRYLRSRVVSMPSWELFKHQSQDYQDSVLPPQVHARVAIEAGTGLGWREYVGSEGRVIARYDFGASPPIKELLQHFGFTADRVASEARSLIKR